jgi:hypothetical protein
LLSIRVDRVVIVQIFGFAASGAALAGETSFGGLGLRELAEVRCY